MNDAKKIEELKQAIKQCEDAFKQYKENVTKKHGEL